MWTVFTTTHDLDLNKSTPNLLWQLHVEDLSNITQSIHATLSQKAPVMWRGGFQLIFVSYSTVMNNNTVLDEGVDLTLVPDGVLRGVDLRPRMLLNPGQGCSSSPLGSFTGSMAIILGTGAALHPFGLRTTVLWGQKSEVRRHVVGSCWPSCFCSNTDTYFAVTSTPEKCAF